VCTKAYWSLNASATAQYFNS